VATVYRDPLLLGFGGQNGPKAAVLKAYVGAFMESNRDSDGLIIRLAQKTLKIWFDANFLPKLAPIMKGKTFKVNHVKPSGNGFKAGSMEVKKEDDFVSRMASVKKRKTDL
jgi:hypothetical protein